MKLKMLSYTCCIVCYQFLKPTRVVLHEKKDGILMAEEQSANQKEQESPSNFIDVHILLSFSPKLNK